MLKHSFHLAQITGTYNITDCIGEKIRRHIGCVMLTSYVNQGEVHCVGDGVDETIRYPHVTFGECVCVFKILVD